MITMSVPAFVTLTTALWVAAGLMLVAALVFAWRGKLLLALGTSAAGSLLVNVPPAAVMTQLIKLDFDRQDQLLETGVGKAVSAIALVFAMTGVMPFMTVFLAAALLALLFYGIGSLVR